MTPSSSGMTARTRSRNKHAAIAPISASATRKLGEENSRNLPCRHTALHAKLLAIDAPLFQPIGTQLGCKLDNLLRDVNFLHRLERCI
jgi:hypothetical protein